MSTLNYIGREQKNEYLIRKKGTRSADLTRAIIESKKKEKDNNDLSVQVKWLKCAHD